MGYNATAGKSARQAFIDKIGTSAMTNDNFVQTGDARDIPMTLGLIVMVWNSCELQMRHLLRSLGSKGSYQNWEAVEVLVSELGSVALTQALHCYAREFPEDVQDIPAAIRHVAQTVENCRAYRNYYVHNISGVTGYGLDFSYDTMEADTPVHESMMVGPFAKVYSKTAKGKRKFFMDFIRVEDLIGFNNYLADLEEYLQALSTAVTHYFRDVPFGERASLPNPLPPLAALKKPEMDHPKLKLRPALAPWVRVEDEVDAED